MTKPDFKELKDKLTIFDSKKSFEELMKESRDKNPNHKEYVLEFYSGARNAGRYEQHSKDTETIKELVEIISFQQEVFERIKTYVKPHRDGLDGRFEETKATIESCVAITETTTRLQKLMGDK